MSERTFATIRDIICQVAKIPPEEVRLENSVTGLTNVDSLILLEIVARTELKLGIEIDEGSLFEISTVGEFVETCDRLCATAAA